MDASRSHQMQAAVCQDICMGNYNVKMVCFNNILYAMGIDKQISVEMIERTLTWCDKTDFNKLCFNFFTCLSIGA